MRNSSLTPSPLTTFSPHPLMEGVVGVCHSVDVGTVQAMLTEHPKLDITLTTQGGSHHRWEKSHTSSLLYRSASLPLLPRLTSSTWCSPPQMNLVHMVLSSPDEPRPCGALLPVNLVHVVLSSPDEPGPRGTLLPR